MTSPAAPPPHPLTTTAVRARAAASVRTLTDLPSLASMLVADILDGTSAAALRAAGLTDDEARAVLAEMWADQ